MNQVAFVSGGFNNIDNQFHYGSGPSPQQTHVTHREARGSAPVLQDGYYDGGIAGQSSFFLPLIHRFSPPCDFHCEASRAVQTGQVLSLKQLTGENAGQHNLSQSASTHQRLSPNAASHAQLKQHTPANRYPMAAPPLPQTPSNRQQAASSDTASSPQTPQSPGNQNREQQRVALLLDINVELLHEVNRLQSEGKGGATSPQIQAQMKSQGQPSDFASDEYMQVLRRVQANLGYLMPTAQGDQQKVPKGPVHMTPPQHMPQLQSKYDQLQELFPDWPGMDRRPLASSASPGYNGMSGTPTGATPSQG